MHLSLIYQRPSRGVTPGTFASMARDLSTVVVNFKPGMGGLECFCTFVAGSQGSTLGICSAAAILQMELEMSAVPFCKRTGYVGEHVLAKW